MLAQKEQILRFGKGSTNRKSGDSGEPAGRKRDEPTTRSASKRDESGARASSRRPLQTCLYRGRKRDLDSPFLPILLRQLLQSDVSEDSTFQELHQVESTSNHALVRAYLPVDSRSWDALVPLREREGLVVGLDSGEDEMLSFDRMLFVRGFAVSATSRVSGYALC